MGFPALRAPRVGPSPAGQVYSQSFSASLLSPFAGYNRSLTVNHAQVPSTQTNFPVLVSLSDTTLKTVANGGHVRRSDGFDINFYADLAHSTKLKWEMESYDGSAGTLVAWVKIPSLSSSSDTIFYMFYGDPTITTDQSDPANTWDANFKAVWHMADNAASTTIRESTALGANATNNANTNTKAITGQIGNALSYNGTSDGSSAAVDLSSASIITLSAWINWGTNANNDALAFEYTTNYVSSNGFIIDWNSSSGGFDFGMSFSGTFWVDSIVRPSAGAWYLVHLVMDRLTPINKLYRNGAIQTITPSNHTGSGGTFANSSLYFMSRAASSLNAAGTLDEVRLSTIERSADWITTEYNNQNAPGTFITLGTEIGGGFGTLSLRTQKALTATFSPVAILSRRLAKSLTAMLSFTAALIRKIFDAGFTAILSFTGALTKTIQRFKSFSAVLGFGSAQYYNPPPAPPFLLSGPGTAHNFYGNGVNLRASRFRLIIESGNTVTGNIYSKLYASTGTFDVNARPAGSSLATSNPVDSAILTSAAQWIQFDFPIPYLMAAGTEFFIALEWPGWTAGNNISMEVTNPFYGSAPAPGVTAQMDASSLWSNPGAPADDIFFQVIGESLTKRTGKPFTAALSFIAAIGKRMGKALTATLSFTAALTKKYLDSGFSAVLSFIGNLAVSKLFVRAFTAALSFSGLLSVSKAFLKAFSAALSFTAGLSRRTGKTLTATLTFTPAFTKKIVDSGFTATLAFTATIAKNIRKTLTATLSFIGNLATSFIAGGGHLFFQSYTATLSFAGAIAKLPQKAFAANFGTSGSLIRKFLDAGFTATLSFVGFLSASKAFLKSFVATLSFTGLLTVSKSFLKAFTATLSFTGALSRRAGKAFSAILSSSASLVRRISHAFSAILSSAGSLVKAIRDAGFIATLSFVGNLTSVAVHFFTRSFAATLSFVGNLARSRTFARALTATLNMTGAIRRQLQKSIAATLSFSGALRRAIRKGLAAVLSFAVFFFKGGAVEILAGLVTKAGALIGLAGSTARISKAGSQLDVVERGSGANIQVTGSNLRVERTK